MLDIMMNNVSSRTLTTMHRNNQFMDSTQQRLSSGSRFLSAGDDASGLMIATRKNTMIRGNEKVMENVQTSISLVENTTGAQSLVVESLQRMREVAIRAASNPYGELAPSDFNEEYQHLRNEIDRMVQKTNFNGIQLLGPTSIGTGFELNLTFHVGSAYDDKISVQMKDIRSSQLGLNGTDLLTTDNANSAIEAVDQALNIVTTQQQYLGSISNKLEATLQHLNSYQNELKGSMSRLTDADFAVEMSGLVRGKIITQMNTNALLQANFVRENFSGLFQSLV